MRVAFVSANREQLPDPVIPLGLLYVMSSLPSRHDRILVDLCFEPDPLRAVREQLSAFAPDLIAVGIRNVQSNLYDGMAQNLAAYAELGRTLRDVSSAPIVIGGSAVGVIPEQLMEVIGADYAIAGEAERALEDLVAALEAPITTLERLMRIPRVFFRRAGRIFGTRVPAHALDLDRVPRPAREHLDPRYDERVGIESVQTKRGCNLACTYCTYPRIEGSIVRTRDPALVVDELIALQRSGRPIRHVFVVDSVFNRPKSHAKAICRTMIARGFALPWTCYINPLGFDRELADLMAAAGCAGVEIGSDSGCDRVLTSLGKRFDTRRIRTVHELCREAGLPDCHTFVVGTQTESIEDVEQTLSFVEDLDPFAAIFMVWTDDEEATRDVRRRQTTRRERIEQTLVGRARSHPRWIVPTASQNFGARLFEALRRQGCAGPLWQSIRFAEEGARGSRDLGRELGCAQPGSEPPGTDRGE